MEQTYPMHPGDPGAAVFGCFFVVIMIVALAVNFLLVVWPFCKIFSKAGFHWALGLLMMVPIANIIMPLYLAFAEWPIHKQPYQPQPNPDGVPSQDSEPPRENFRGM